MTHCSPVLSMPTEIALVTSTSSCPIMILRNMSVVAMACLGGEDQREGERVRERKKGKKEVGRETEYG